AVRDAGEIGPARSRCCAGPHTRVLVSSPRFVRHAARPALAASGHVDPIATGPDPEALVPPIVTFTSDFGLTDWFVGVVHGVIHEHCPLAQIVNLSHAIPAGDVDAAAFVIEAATPDFPP